MKINEALNLANKRLNNIKIARKIACLHLKLSFEEFFLRQHEQMPKIDEYFGLCERFLQGEPFEYISGVCEFLNHEFKVGKGVLIPRCETEILVKKTLLIAKNFKNPKICEIGTGSGIIAISLALNLPNAEIIASDISLEALNYAKINAKNLGVKIDFYHTNLMDEIQGEFDIIVSNPPYIANDYELDIWVRHEPDLALFGGKKGDEVLKEIISLASKRAKFLCCEMGYDQKKSLKNELDKFRFESEFYKDLAGFDRGFVAKISS